MTSSRPPLHQRRDSSGPAVLSPPFHAKNESDGSGSFRRRPRLNSDDVSLNSFARRARADTVSDGEGSLILAGSINSDVDGTFVDETEMTEGYDESGNIIRRARVDSCGGDRRGKGNIREIGYDSHCDGGDDGGDGRYRLRTSPLPSLTVGSIATTATTHIDQQKAFRTLHSASGKENGPPKNLSLFSVLADDIHDYLEREADVVVLGGRGADRDHLHTSQPRKTRGHCTRPCLSSTTRRQSIPGSGIPRNNAVDSPAFSVHEREYLRSLVDRRSPSTVRSRSPSPCRPPTARGSHRPGLPSIERDDWGGDDHRAERYQAGRTNIPYQASKTRSYCDSYEGDVDCDSSTSSSSSSSSHTESEEYDGDDYVDDNELQISVETDPLLPFRTTSTSASDWRGQTVPLRGIKGSGSHRQPAVIGKMQEWRRKHRSRGRNHSKVELLKLNDDRRKAWGKSKQIAIDYSPMDYSKTIRTANMMALSSKRSESAKKPLQRRRDLADILDLIIVYISNFPSLVGALALSWASLGVDWFKYVEETIDDCKPVDFHSAMCTYPEFPGCFSCDQNMYYQFGLIFHLSCSAVSATMILIYVLKCIVAFPVIREEMSNPTTAAPFGLVCMATVKVFAGHSLFGKIVTFVTCGVHFFLATWFIFISLVYKTLPDPSWFPNTTGIGLAAVKMFLYYPFPAVGLMALSLLCTILFFPISLLRVSANKKISSPICWIMMSAPAVCLYGLSIMSQPATDEAEQRLQEDSSEFYQLHRKVYLPIMHFFFFLCLVGLCSAVHAFIVRWPDFRQKEFSPAHASFCAPLLSHVNATQAYRSVVNKFGRFEVGSPFKTWLYFYWLLLLVVGTFLTVIVTFKFFVCLPCWVLPDIEDDEIPPEPSETSIAPIICEGAARDKMIQPFVSAAVLQANETGALIRVLRGREDGRGSYVRSRRVPSMGFDPTLNLRELDGEREALLGRGACNRSRIRRHTLSFTQRDVDACFYGEHFREHHASQYSSNAGRGRSRHYSRSMDASLQFLGLE